MLHTKQRGGWRWTDEELQKELMLAKIVRILKEDGEKEEPNSMNPEQLRRAIQKHMDALFLLRMALSKKTGDVPRGRSDINFEKYVTE